MFAESGELDFRARIRRVLEKTQENVRIVRNLLMSELDVELMEMMRQAFHADFEKGVEARKIKPEALPGPLEVISAYYAAGITNAIIFWIRRNMPYSLDEMADCLYVLLPAEIHGR